MQLLNEEHRPLLRGWLLPERVGRLVGVHSLTRGEGSWWIDRWPEPRCLMISMGGNLAFAGDPEALSPPALARIVEAELAWRDTLFTEPVEAFAEPVLQTGLATTDWRRVHFVMDPRASPRGVAADSQVRRLEPRHAPALARLDESIRWIGNTLGGPEGLARSGAAFGVFEGDRPVSIAVPYFVGEALEELAVVTEPGRRGRGLSPACAAAVVADVRSRGHEACWSTTPENVASQRVAEKLGMRRLPEEIAYAFGVPPDPTQ